MRILSICCFTVTMLLFAGSFASQAQTSGEALYVAKCQMCHGSKGAAETPVAKNLKIKPAGDAEMKKLSAAQMTESVTNGKNRMPSFKGKLSDEQIKEVVAYFRSLK